MTIITIGYSKQVFNADSEERARMRACAYEAGTLHSVVFTHGAEAYASADDGPLHLHPTQSRSRLGMLFDAYRIGRDLLSRRGSASEQWILSAQDPFEAGLVGYLLSRRYRVPLQVQEHGDFFGSPYWRRERVLNRLRYLFGIWLVRRADCVRAVSERVKRHLVSVGVIASRIALLAVSSDIAPFSSGRPAAPEHDLRAEHPSAEAIVIAVGRLVKEKNYPLLIRALAGVVREYPTVHLALVGSGPEEAGLRRLAGDLGVSSAVSFIPWTDDVASYMKRADIFALSSYREGWGRVIIEGMAAGIPGVVTDVGCAGEAFMDGRDGFVVPVSDERAFADALAKLVADPDLRRRYGAAARSASAAYAVSHIAYAKAWVETFRTCLKSPSALSPSSFERSLYS